MKLRIESTNGEVGVWPKLDEEGPGYVIQITRDISKFKDDPDYDKPCVDQVIDENGIRAVSLYLSTEAAFALYYLLETWLGAEAPPEIVSAGKTIPSGLFAGLPISIRCDRCNEMWSDHVPGSTTACDGFASVVAQAPPPEETYLAQAPPENENTMARSATMNNFEDWYSGIDDDAISGKELLRAAYQAGSQRKDDEK